MIDQTVLSRMSIAIVDDHDLIREGLNSLLSSNGAGHVEAFATGADLIRALDADTSTQEPRRSCFDFYIVDLELPDVDGFVLIEMIRARFPCARIIVSTVHDEIWTLRKLVARDVNAIIYKSGSSRAILRAMKEIMAGHTFYCDDARKALGIAGDSSRHPTPRELEVLYHISMGKTAKEIAGALFVSENTVEAHRKSLFRKLSAINVADLVVKAIERGYLKKGNAGY